MVVTTWTGENARQTRIGHYIHVLIRHKVAHVWHKQDMICCLAKYRSETQCLAMLASEIESQSCYKKPGQQVSVKSWLPVDSNLPPTCPCPGLGNMDVIEYFELDHGTLSTLSMTSGSMSTTCRRLGEASLQGHSDPTGRSFRSVRACMRPSLFMSNQGWNDGLSAFPFPFWPWGFHLFPLPFRTC